MPSRPSAARRRFHTDRVIAKRVGQVRSLWWFDDVERVRGRLDDEQWYLGCHRARCGVCHPEKRWSHGDRKREDRVWRQREQGAWGVRDGTGDDVRGTAELLDGRDGPGARRGRV